MAYRDQVTRLSLAQVRAQFAPRLFKKLKTVRFELGLAVHEVALEQGAGSGCIPSRPWLVCLRCGRRAGVLGFVDGRWVCRGCGGWRSRNRLRQNLAGAVRHRDGSAPGPYLGAQR